ncbi:Carbonic anhydrase 1 [Dufourea novaeangliae]|uniref:Carbonic anhydrase 1 n=1 Tax=Dufourea novaeangliae TaxID=178035 RepID=A0A154PKV2_DUFNO|nr:Carbonic anhydrase 1 [Dufourea novaeangliae]
MTVIKLNPLQWVNIDITPRKMKITNTGYTVILSATWVTDRPYLTDGPFTAKYVLSQIHFHWGENDMNGSEHTVDGASMPMECHAVHYKSNYETLELALKRTDGVVIVVYLCKLQNKPNEFIHQIVKNFPTIRAANSSVRLVPMNLTNILRPFTEDYFLYRGSIVTSTNIHKIMWVISREPVGVSIEQVAAFRTLMNERGMPILSNVRIVQEAKHSSIFHVCPSGSTYASLLPLPWHSWSSTKDGNSPNTVHASIENT